MSRKPFGERPGGRPPQMTPQARPELDDDLDGDDEDLELEGAYDRVQAKQDHAQREELRRLRPIAAHAEKLAQEHKTFREERDVARAREAFVLGERDRLLVLVGRLAWELDLPQGLAWDPHGDEEWRTCYVLGLPAGQVFWPIHESEIELFDFLGLEEPYPTVPPDALNLTDEERYRRAIEPRLEDR